MMRSKTAVVGCILACLAVAGIASTANAAVVAGVVGGAGIHMQYGPQNASGDYLGIASESYEALADYALGWTDLFPTWSGAQTPPDGLGVGYVLLAFNPYTGEVWNDIPVEYQALSGHPTYASMGAHAPTVGLTDVDGDSNPIASDVVQADLGRGYAEDTVFITGAFVYGPAGAEAFHTYGAYLNTSSDGGILSTRGNAESIYSVPALAGVAGGPALMAGGEEIRPYLAGDPLRPLMYDTTDLQDQNFDQTKTWANTPFWYDDGAGNSGFWGYDGPVAGFDYYGFEMDGIRGWMKLGFTAPGLAVNGIRLTEYYFDIPEPATMTLLAIGGLAILRRKSKIPSGRS